MYAVVHSATQTALRAAAVQVEVFLAAGLPSFRIVGLPSSAVQESRDRIRAALRHIGIILPPRRITVNLAPAALPKSGPQLDFALAVALLAALGTVPSNQASEWLIAGELNLAGELQPLRNAVSYGILARKTQLPLLLPAASAAEAASVPGARVYGVNTLPNAVAFLRGELDLPKVTGLQPRELGNQFSHASLADVRGQAHAKRAVEIAAAGQHHMLLIGPPGVGKSMLARRLPGLRAPLSTDAALTVRQIHASHRLVPDEALNITPPVRVPHHSSTVAGMLGTTRGAVFVPGELSLAHEGVLILDEFPLFNRAVREALREPLEEGRVRLARKSGNLNLPARAQFVFTANPCPCGFLTSEQGQACTCAPSEIRRYQQAFSGPLLDRIDVVVPLNEVTLQPATAEHEPTGAVDIGVRARNRSIIATQRMIARQSAPNGALTGKALMEHCNLEPQGSALLGSLVNSFRLSGRRHDAIVRVARTIADLEGIPAITARHVAEAASYRHNGFGVPDGRSTT